MASIDTFLLDSSPPRQFKSYHMSSSPVLPSLSEIFKTKAQILRTGSPAAPIPQNATAPFTSAASFLKRPTSTNLVDVESIRSFKLDTGDEHISEFQGPAKPTKSKSEKPSITTDTSDGKTKVAKAPRKTTSKEKEGEKDVTSIKKEPKPRAKMSEVVGENGEVKEVVSRKSRTKKVDKAPAGVEPVKEKAARKPRTKKVDSEAQTKLPRGQVTKSARKSKSITNKPIDSVADSLDYGLVEAVRRRSDWTPPPVSAKIPTTTPIPVDVPDGVAISGGSILSGEKNAGFKDLFGSFGFEDKGSKATDKKTLHGAGIKKRKLIELVKTNISAAPSAATTPKTKAPKKKVRTITEKATSAYAEVQQESPPAQPAPLLQYFSCQTLDRNVGTSVKAPTKARSKSPVKKAIRAKKGTAEAPILLSPKSAMRQVRNQDFVFGTSSQLAREESPTLLRDLHEAMQASNEVDDDPFADILEESTVPLVFSSRTKTIASTKRTFWSAGARNGTGNTTDVEMVDMVDSPAVAKLIKSMNDQEIGLFTPDSDDVWHDIEDVNMPRKISSVDEPMSKEEPDVELSEVSTAPRAVELFSEEPTKLATKPASSQGFQKPDFGSYSTAQLSQELASYHFKPIKNRDQIISILERCWEGKNRTALGVLETNVPTTSSVKTVKPPPSTQVDALSIKRPRGRPKKDSTSSISTSPAKKAIAKVSRSKAKDRVEFLEIDSDVPLSKVRTPKKPQKSCQPIEDISDSDAPTTPSPRRRRASQPSTPLLPLNFSHSTNEDDGELIPASLQASLFQHITRAVTNAPPSKDPTKPSLQEKMLLYDPIILEDLTRWLNTGPLEKAGWDGEIRPKEVKNWCESKGVCCLWRENLRGVARRRF